MTAEDLKATLDVELTRIKKMTGASNIALNVVYDNGGAAVTAADLQGTGVFLVFNDRFNGILQIIQTAPAGA